MQFEKFRSVPSTHKGSTLVSRHHVLIEYSDGFLSFEVDDCEQYGSWGQAEIPVCAELIEFFKNVEKEFRSSSEVQKKEDRHV